MRRSRLKGTVWEDNPDLKPPERMIYFGDRPVLQSPSTDARIFWRSFRKYRPQFAPWTLPWLIALAALLGLSLWKPTEVVAGLLLRVVAIGGAIAVAAHNRDLLQRQRAARIHQLPPVSLLAMLLFMAVLIFTALAIGGLVMMMFGAGDDE